jgi:hypothetical protein
MLYGGRRSTVHHRDALRSGVAPELRPAVTSVVRGLATNDPTMAVEGAQCLLRAGQASALFGLVERKEVGSWDDWREFVKTLNMSLLASHPELQEAVASEAKSLVRLVSYAFGLTIKELEATEAVSRLLVDDDQNWARRNHPTRLVFSTEYLHTHFLNERIAPIAMKHVADLMADRQQSAFEAIGIKDAEGIRLPARRWLGLIKHLRQLEANATRPDRVLANARDYVNTHCEPKR